ncbi:major capsid protein [Roseomonas sp. HJA6]|uniref:Major capsid protein n=1 Tax=Roseomonas alba TaxID=2846776 RepID=A0ABS7ACF6_9PROT|nr:major capsid protein [Neoroseomonas alba]MBW6399987.1 major capsid protein [Neoroseomonas alba]
MLNIFQNDAFSTVALTRLLNATPYIPNLLDTLGIFAEEKIGVRSAAIERLGNQLSLVPTTPDGAPPATTPRDKRTIRDVRTVRLAQTDRIYAHELANLRRPGSELDLEEVSDFALRRMQKLRQKNDLTLENLRLGCVTGSVKDADGTTVLFDPAAFWGVTLPTAIDFNLDIDTTDVDGKCRSVVRLMEKNSEGGMLPNSTIYGLCGDAFFDAFVAHPNVKTWYLNRPAADQYLAGTTTRRVTFGGIVFINYRGTDDGTTVGVNTDHCRFVLAGGDEVFSMLFSASNENFELMNLPALPVYAMMSIDPSARKAWVDVDVFSYPLPIVKRPLTLIYATRT